MDSITHSLYKAISASTAQLMPLSKSPKARKAYPSAEDTDLYVPLVSSPELLAFQLELLGAGHAVSPTLYSAGADVIISARGILLVSGDFRVELTLGHNKYGDKGGSCWKASEPEARILTRYADANGSEHFLNKANNKEAWIEVTAAGFWVGHFDGGSTGAVVMSAFPFGSAADAQAEVERLLA